MQKTQIRDQAAALFNRISFAKTSVADIAKACGMGKGTFYLYYKSKDDIVFAIIEERIAKLGEANAAFFADPSVSLPDKMERFFDDVINEVFAIKELIVGSFENVEGKAIKQVFFKYGSFFEWCIDLFADIARPYASYAEAEAEAFRENVKSFMELMMGRMILFLVSRDWNDKDGLKRFIQPLAKRLVFPLIVQNEKP